MKISGKLKKLLPFATPIGIMLILYLGYGAFTYRGSLELCAKRVPNFEEAAFGENGTQNNINLLLLAYARSGSSFMGELLSTGDDVFYVFEPSFEHVQTKNMEDADAVIRILDGIYNCDLEILAMLGINQVGGQGVPFFYQKTEKYTDENLGAIIANCRASRIRLIKTIRLSMDIAEQLMAAKPLLNLKIVHLVRDPRGMVNSLNKKTIWSKAMHRKASSCEALREDLKVSESISKDKYIRVRYEDLSTKILETAVGVYQNTGLPLTDNLACYIAYHTQFESIGVIDRREEYYSTFKNQDFDPNRWKYTLKWQEIERIERDCEDVIRRLSYEFYVTKLKAISNK